MIIDLESQDAGSLPGEAAVCIVGAGAVGLSLAVSLARQGTRVLLLEGGGRTLETKTQALQEGESAGHPFKNIGVGRYRVLGGSTVYWGGQVLPFDRFIVGGRPWIGHEQWPVEAADLEHYYRACYALLGLGGACFDDEQIWRSIGLPVPALSDDIEFLFTRWVPTRNLSKHFGPDLRGPNVTTLLHANVCAIKMDEGGRRVRSLVVRTLDGKSLEIKAKLFVLANGTLEMARLLLHPLADGSRAIWHEFEYLGSPLIDHLDCMGGEVNITNHEAARSIFDNIYLKGYKYYPRMRLATGAQRTHGLMDIAAQFLYRTRFSEHLDYLKMFLRSIKDGGAPVSALQLPRHAAAIARTALPLAARYFKDRRSFKPRDAEVSLAFYCEQAPTRGSRLTLMNGAADALGMRRLRVNWRIDGRELRTVKFFGLTIKEALEARGLATVTLDPLLLDEDPSFIGRMQDAVHQMGTARMAQSCDRGVVDSDLKVFGTDNLFLAGAAVFPSTGFANPTFTAIALSLRLADHLQGRVHAVSSP